MTIVADTLSGWRAVPWADEQSDPRDRACEVTSHDGDNPSKWRYESAPWKGATAESQKTKNFFFFILYSYHFNSLFFVFFFSRSAASTTPGLSIIWGFNTLPRPSSFHWNTHALTEQFWSSNYLERRSLECQLGSEQKFFTPDSNWDRS
jgi:hypothetical protein